MVVKIVLYWWKFGGSAMTPKESEHFVSAAVKAIEIKADIFISILQSGGMAVTGGVPVSSGMVKTQIAYSELKKSRDFINWGCTTLNWRVEELRYVV